MKRSSSSAVTRLTQRPGHEPRSCWNGLWPAVTSTGKPSAIGLLAPKNGGCRPVTSSGSSSMHSRSPAGGPRPASTVRSGSTALLTSSSPAAAPCQDCVRSPLTISGSPFDKNVATRPRGDDDAGLPAPELCGPGHPLFDALVELTIERTRPEVTNGAVFFDPSGSAPAVIRFLTGEVRDGNGEVVRRSLAAARSLAGAFSPAPVISLFDVIAPEDEELTRRSETGTAPPTDPELVMWARQHLFEPVYAQAKTEREERRTAVGHNAFERVRGKSHASSSGCIQPEAARDGPLGRPAGFAIVPARSRLLRSRPRNQVRPPPRPRRQSPLDRVARSSIDRSVATRDAACWRSVVGSCRSPFQAVDANTKDVVVTTSLLFSCDGSGSHADTTTPRR